MVTKTNDKAVKVYLRSREDSLLELAASEVADQLFLSERKVVALVPEYLKDAFMSMVLAVALHKEWVGAQGLSVREVYEGLQILRPDLIQAASIYKDELGHVFTVIVAEEDDLASQTNRVLDLSADSRGSAFIFVNTNFPYDPRIAENRLNFVANTLSNHESNNVAVFFRTDTATVDRDLYAKFLATENQHDVISF